MATESWPRALFGGPLEGSALVRYLYVDEAGISAKEPVTVVVGIIVHADKQWRLAESNLKQVLEAVPEQHRPGFIFHATAVWSDMKLREGWGMDERLSLLHAVMSLPRQLNMPLAVGIVRREAKQPQNLSPKISPIQFQHLMAFYLCVSRADKYVRDYGEPEEVMTVISEDTDIHRTLRVVVKKTNPLTLLPDAISPTQAEQASGVIEQDGVFMVVRVIDSVHFVAKEGGLLLQIVDACAFGFRRYFSGQSHGEDFVRSMLGGNLIAEDWAGPSSASTFFWHKPINQ